MSIDFTLSPELEALRLRVRDFITTVVMERRDRLRRRVVERDVDRPDAIAELLESSLHTAGLQPDRAFTDRVMGQARRGGKRCRRGPDPEVP